MHSSLKDKSRLLEILQFHRKIVLPKLPPVITSNVAKISWSTSIKEKIKKLISPCVRNTRVHDTVTRCLLTFNLLNLNWSVKFKADPFCSWCAIYCAIQSHFWICEWNPSFSFKWKLLSSTFLWPCRCSLYSLKVFLTVDEILPCDLSKRENYSWSSRKRPPREFRKVVSTRAGRLREWALVSDHMMKQ